MTGRTLSDVIDSIQPADAGAMRRALSRQRNLTKPPGSLGRLEDVSVQLAGIFGSELPAIGGKAVIVAAGRPWRCGARSNRLSAGSNGADGSQLPRGRRGCQRNGAAGGRKADYR